LAKAFEKFCFTFFTHGYFQEPRWTRDSDDAAIKDAATNPLHHGSWGYSENLSEALSQNPRAGYDRTFSVKTK
jgi:hypothetical protein